MGSEMCIRDSAEVVYEGKWYTPLREAIQAFVDVTQKYVTGEVKFKLFKGNIIKAGESSPYSLYNESLASFTTGDLYDHHDADGFITLFGLPLKVRAMKMQELEKNNNKEDLILWIPKRKRTRSAFFFCMQKGPAHFRQVPLFIRNMRRFRPQFPVPSCFGNPRLPSNGPRKDCS